MHATELFKALQARLRHPGRGGWLLLLSAAWVPLRLLLNLPYGRFGAGEAFLPFGIMAGTLALAPLAWQWTGDGAPLTSAGRGTLQSLAWNGLWLGLLVLGFRSLAGQEPPPPPFLPGEAQVGRPFPPPVHRPPHGSPELFLFSLALLFATVLGRALAEQEAADLREARLEQETERARAIALQAQMQPHALFNALSGLVELVREDPEATEEALVALCDYLRRLMDHARREKAPLRAERELVKDYLRIEQIRIGGRLTVTWDWPAWGDALSLPPLLLQPLVENAVLHGIAPVSESCELRIALARAGDRLYLQVENTGRPPQGDREGLGIGHLKQRLILWAGAQGRLELVRKGGWTCACITLPTPS